MQHCAAHSVGGQTSRDLLGCCSCGGRTVSSLGQLVHPAAPHCCSEAFDAAILEGHVAPSMLFAAGHWLMLIALTAPTPPQRSPALPVHVTLQPVDFGMVYGPNPWSQRQSPPASTPAMAPTPKPASQQSATQRKGVIFGSLRQSIPAILTQRQQLPSEYPPLTTISVLNRQCYGRENGTRPHFHTTTLGR
eukprot:COSAG02_NODE_549_length_20461_cov_11.385866_24_plen_191_part_00